jgi:hypothetical protein
MREASELAILQRAQALRRPESGANRVAAAELKAERAEEPAGQEAKWQARNFDPGMASVKADVVTGE